MKNFIKKLLYEKVYKCYECKHETTTPDLYRHDLYICPRCRGTVGYLWRDRKTKEIIK